MMECAPKLSVMLYQNIAFDEEITNHVRENLLFLNLHSMIFDIFLWKIQITFIKISKYRQGDGNGKWKWQTS